MFIGFFYALKYRKVPVSITEWMTLMQALALGHAQNLDDFYYVARAILVKSENYFDQYDVAFQEYFQGAEFPPEISEQIWEWLESPRVQEMMQQVPQVEGISSLEELLRQFEERLRTQTEQHDGGSKWIGRGGTSPFGHSGYHPAGIRVGGNSMGGHAVQIAMQRRFRDYRSDLTLDIRQIKVALRKVRQLSRIGPQDELDLDQTIDATCKNAGDIELIWRRARKNAVKLLLLMDVGGTMEPYARLCSLLFSAAHSASHFKDFQYYYFHNCLYDRAYKNAARSEDDSVDTNHLLHTLEPDYRVVFVGDAQMSLWELSEEYGAIEYVDRNETPGFVWLKRFADHFHHCVWLNPVQARDWNYQSQALIGRVFPMFELTLDGLEQAVKKLIVNR